MKVLFHVLLLSLCAVTSPRRALASDTNHNWELGISFEQHEYVTTRYRAAVAGLPRFPGALGVFFGSMDFSEAESASSRSEETEAAREFGLEYRFKSDAMGTQLIRPWGEVQIGRTSYKDHEKRPFRGNNFAGYGIGLSFGSKPIDIYIRLDYRMVFIPKTDASVYLGNKPMEKSMVYPGLGFDFLF